MGRLEKLLSDFLKRPEGLRYREIEKVLLHVGCEKVQAKGRHVKFKHSKLRYDIIIPVHGGDCKDFYKKLARDRIQDLVAKI